MFARLFSSPAVVGPALGAVLCTTAAPVAGAQSPTPARPAPAADARLDARAVDARAIAGDVIEAESGVPLAGATVVLVAAERGAVAVGATGGEGAAPAGAFVAAARRASTDEAGHYRFGGVPAGRYVLRVYRLGFRPATVEVELQEGAPAGGVVSGIGDARVSEARVSVGLTVVPIRLRPVAVDAPAPEPYARRARTAAQAASARLAALRVRQARFLSTDAREVTHADVEDAVTLGETDLFRALQRLPGVATQGDASAQLWTRGARWDQTRVTFDGLPLFNPLHTGGAISGINSDAVGAAFLLPGVRPASVGEGSAAVLDLRSRAGGGAGGVRGAGELSLISARAALDGTVAGGRGAWMVAARRSYLDLILNRIVHDSAGSAFPYYMGEVTGRADWRFGGGRAVEVSVLHSRDQVTEATPNLAPFTDSRAGWGNTAARASFTTPARLGPLGAGTLRTTLGVSAYYAAHGYTYTTSYRDTIFAQQLVRQRVTYATLAGEFTPTSTAPDSAAPGAAPRRRGEWTGGYALVAQRAAADGALAAVYTAAAVVDPAPVSRRTSLPMLAVWGERRLAPLPSLTVAAGLRVEGGTPVRGDGPLRLAPRLSARYQLGPTTAASAAVGRHYQYFQGVPSAFIDVSDPELAVVRPAPLWIGAARATPALRTDLATAGLERWTGAGWDWTANAYARRTTGLALGDQRPGPAVDRPLFVVGREAAVGLEVGVRRLVGRWTGSANYALGAATTRAYGLRFPSAEDRRHVFNATAGVRVGGGGRIGAAFTALSGAPFTPATGATYYVNDAVDAVVRVVPPAFGAPNSVRLPAFRRLDLLAEWTWAIRRARVGGYLQLINAAGRRNPLGVPYRSAHVEDAAGRVIYGDDSDTSAPAGFITFPLIGFRATF